MSLSGADTPPLGPYRLLHLLGRGGMGEVWAAQHVHRGEPVAVKLITGAAARDRRYQVAFGREVRAVAGLDHPGIVRVYDHGRVSAAAAEALNLHEGAPWLAMELLGGGSLRQRGTVLTWPQLVRVLDTLLGALAHAHARGVTHRDLKPDNVLASADHQRIVLTDFGVAHAADRETGALTDSNTLSETVGTPAYMAPEQIRGHWRDQGPWTDLYALGCMAWELVCGTPPLMRGAALATMVAQLSQPLPELQPRVSIPAALAPWIMRLLAKSPGDRFAHAADARLALGRVAAHPTPTLAARPASVPVRNTGSAPARVRGATLAERRASAKGPDPFADPFEGPMEGQDLQPAAAPAHTHPARPMPPESEAPVVTPVSPGSRPKATPQPTPRFGPWDLEPHPSGTGLVSVDAWASPSIGALPDGHLDPSIFEPGLQGDEGLSPDPAMAPTLASETPAPAPNLSFSTDHFGAEASPLPARPSAAPRSQPLDPRPACPADWRTAESRTEADLSPQSSASSATLELGPGEPSDPSLDHAASLALAAHDGVNDDGPAAGLGLFGLRTIPFVGREHERDALWAALHRVTERAELQGILLLGPSGYGKTRLSTWLSEQAQELGVATAVRVVASQPRGPGDGLGAMVRRVVRGQGLARAELRGRVESWLIDNGGADPDLCELLVALVDPAAAPASPVSPTGAPGAQDAIPPPLHGAEDDGEPPAGLLSPPADSATLRTEPTPSEGPAAVCLASEEVLAAATRFISRLAESRPVVLVLEDVQWSPLALDWARHLLNQTIEVTGPVLVLVTMRTDAQWPFEPAEVDTTTSGDLATVDRLPGLAALRALPNLGVLSVGRLPPNSRHAMMQAMLGLDPGLARRIDARTGGNPQFAVQLVGAWIERGLLETGPDGVRLRAGADPEVGPFDLMALWRERAEAVLGPYGDMAGAAVELAAALGPTVVGAEWRAACKLAELPVPLEALEALIDAGLAESERDGIREGFSFAHAMLRESILDRARAATRLAAHHRVCARMLALRPHAAVERVARHLAAGERHLASLEPLAAAIEIALEEGDAHGAHDLLELRATALDAAQVAPDDNRRAEDWSRAARVAFLRSNFEQMTALVQRADAAAEAHGWHRMRARVAMSLGTALRERGQAVEARVQFEKAAALAGEHQEVHIQARAWEGLVPLLARAGEREAALGTLLSAQSAFEQVGDAAGAGRCELGLANLFKQAGRLDEAARHNAEAERFFRHGMHRDGLARAANQRGELARLQGHLEVAAEAYREALDRWAVRDARNAVFARANLALVLMEAGRYTDALPLLLRARKAFEQQRRWPMVAALLAVGVTCRADAGDWDQYDLELDQAEDLVARTDLVDADTAHMLERAGQLARAAGHPARAERAYALALMQWLRLDRPERAEAVRSIVAEIVAEIVAAVVPRPPADG